MATIINSIGVFRFISMTPVPPRHRRRTLIETRAGVDGVAVWWEASRGQMYRPATTVDAPSHASAQILKAQYEAACGGNPVSMVYANVVYPNVIIKDVDVRITDQLIGVGGLNPIVRALVRAQWDIIIP